MWHKFTALFIVNVALIVPTATAIAQQAEQPVAPPPAYWPGPWLFWGPFWWICPIMMVVMMIMCGVMFFGRRQSGWGRRE